MTEQAKTLHEQLIRWTADGLIDPGLAGRIEAAEVARTGFTPHRRVPIIAEILGYVGTVVAVTAAFISVRQVFHNITPAAELAITAVAGAGLLIAGAAVRAAREPALARLRSVLWLFGTIAVAGCAEVLTRHFLHLSSQYAALTVELTWLACAWPLWWLTRSVVQHLAVFAGTVGVVETSLFLIEPDAGNFGFGLALWLVAAAWAVATWRRYLAPELTGLLLGGAGLVIGAGVAMDAAAGQVLAVLTVAGLFAVGVLARRVLPIVFGAIGTVYIVPDVAQRYLPGSVWAPLSVGVVGLVLCGVAIWLARSRRADRA